LISEIEFEEEKMFDIVEKHNGKMAMIDENNYFECHKLNAMA